MSKKYFSWSTGFKSIIVVDDELFNNDYTIKLHLTPVTADLKEQGDFFERQKQKDLGKDVKNKQKDIF